MSRMSDPSSSRTFDFTFAADIHGHVVRQRDVLGLRLLLENRHFGLEIRRLNIGDQSPFETGSESLFERGNFMGRAVAADDDLLAGIKQRVERVEELGLRAFLPGQKLNSSTSRTSTVR